MAGGAGRQALEQRRRRHGARAGPAAGEEPEGGGRLWRSGPDGTAGAGAAGRRGEQWQRRCAGKREAADGGPQREEPAEGAGPVDGGAQAGYRGRRRGGAGEGARDQSAAGLGRATAVGRRASGAGDADGERRKK